MTTKKLAFLFGLLLATPAMAADNAVVVTAGTGVTMKSKDVGSGVQAMQPILSDAAGLPIYGTAGTANSNVLTIQGVASMTALTMNLPTGAATSANQGTTADAPCTLPTSTTACSQIAIAKALANSANSAIAAGTNTIGKVGIDLSATTTASAPINVSTATTTQIVAISGSTAIYVTSYDVVAGGTGNITFEYGTGTACATGTTALTGAYPLTAQAGIAKGGGTGVILKVPAGNALCVLTSAAVQMSGSVSYQQF